MLTYLRSRALWLRFPLIVAVLSQVMSPSAFAVCGCGDVPIGSVNDLIEFQQCVEYNCCGDSSNGCANIPLGTCPKDYVLASNGSGCVPIFRTDVTCPFGGDGTPSCPF